MTAQRYGLPCVKDRLTDPAYRQRRGSRQQCLSKSKVLAALKRIEQALLAIAGTPITLPLS